MACGDRYKDLLIVRGHGPDEPCGSNLGLGEWACNALDSQAYNDRADEIMSLNTQAWNALIGIGQHPTANAALMEQVNAYWAAHEAMDRWSLAGIIGQDWDESALLYNAGVVNSSLSVMRQGICVLELLVEAYEAIKGEGSGIDPQHVPPPEPKAGDQIFELVKWGIGGVLLLGAGYVLIKVVKP